MHPLLLALLIALVTGACSGGGDANPPTTCGPAVEEPLDPGSAQHLLPGAAEPRYLDDPPTSGPHLTGQSSSGVRHQPLSRPAQVGILEDGAVLVQHEGVPDDERRQLEALAGDKVVVAPNPSLPVPVVATAWRHRLECEGGVDVAALRAFISQHRRSGGP